MDFGRCKNEHDVRGRLFKSFEQSVERADGEHMNLVNNIDAELTVDGRKAGFVPDIADIVNAVVACGVNFNNIKHSAGVYPTANFTFVAGIAMVGVQAVDRL